MAILHCSRCVVATHKSIGQCLDDLSTLNTQKCALCMMTKNKIITNLRI